MNVKSYKDLIVWQKSMEIVKDVYLLIRKLPKEETYALSSQMRRAAVSIPSNIAEGHARNSSKEFIQFLSIANGSRAELETQLELCVRIGYLTEYDILASINQLAEVSKMIRAITKSLTPNP